MAINLGDAILFFKGDVSQLNNAVSSAQSAMQQKFTAIGNLTSQAGKAFTVFGGAVTGALGLCVKAAAEQEKAEIQLNTVLKSTEHAAGLTADELKKLASGLQDTTAYGDETIMAAESLMLTFTSIGKEVFPQAIETVLDMSTAIGQDTKSSCIMLGKALQDPIRGITALRRVGVNFNDEQMEMVKQMLGTSKEMENLGKKAGEASADMPKLELALEKATYELNQMYMSGQQNTFQFREQQLKVADLQKEMQEATGVIAEYESKQKEAGNEIDKTGKLAEVQKIILAELSREFGGSAKAELQGFSGQMKQLKNYLGDAAEEIGFILIPELGKLAQGLVPVVKSIIEWVKEHPNLTAAFVKFLAVIGPVSLALGTMLLTVRPFITLFITLKSVITAFTTAKEVVGAATVISNVGTAATGASAASSGLIGTLMGAAGLAAAFAFTAYMIYQMLQQYKEWEYWTRVADEKEKALAADVEALTAKLKEKNIAIDENKMALMSNAEKIDYLHGLYKIYRENLQGSAGDVQKLTEAITGQGGALADNIIQQHQHAEQTKGIWSNLWNWFSAGLDRFWRWLTGSLKPPEGPYQPVEGAYAQGGQVSGNALILAGEEGPELARTPRGGKLLLGAGGPGLFAVPMGTYINTAHETARILAGAFASGGLIDWTAADNFGYARLRDNLLATLKRAKSKRSITDEQFEEAGRVIRDGIDRNDVRRVWRDAAGNLIGIEAGSISKDGIVELSRQPWGSRIKRSGGLSSFNLLLSPEGKKAPGELPDKKTAEEIGKLGQWMTGIVNTAVATKKLAAERAQNVIQNVIDATKNIEIVREWRNMSRNLYGVETVAGAMMKRRGDVHGAEFQLGNSRLLLRNIRGYAGGGYVLPTGDARPINLTVSVASMHVREEADIHRVSRELARTLQMSLAGVV